MQFSANSNEFLLTALAQHSGVFVLAIDSDARITTVIGKNNHNINCDAKAAIGQPIDFYFANDPGHAKLFHDVLSNQQPQNVTFHTENGKYFETQIVPLFDEQNKICGALSFENDVTERETLAMQHKAQVKRLEGLFQESEDGIYLLDRDFVIQRANNVATVLHETEGELVGHVCYRRVFGHDEPCEFCPVVKTFHTGQSAEASYFDEKFQKHLQLRSTPLFDPQTGNLIGVFETFRDITDSVKLEYNELQMQAIISGGNVPIAFGDADGKITFVNAAFQALTGYSEEELLGTHFWDTVYDERTRTDTQFLKIRADLYERKLDRHRQDITIRRKDGEVRWVDLTASAVKDVKDQRVQMIIILLDITDRYRIVQAFKEADELARIMLDTAPFGCHLIDQAGSIRDCNTEAYKWFDISSKQEYCERFFELSPQYQPNGQLTADAYKEVIATIFEKGYLCFEWMHQKFDGTPILCEITGVQIKRGNDDIAVCYTHDLREREEMLAKIRKANEQSQMMLDATPIACTLVDRKGKLIACNLATARIFGLNDKKEYDERFWEFSPEYQPNGQLSVEMRREKHEAAFETGHQCYEWMCQKLDGSPLPCEVTLARIRYEDDHVLAVYIRDLQEHTEMLAKIREKDEQAHMMLDANPQGCQIWDENFNIIDCNTAVVNMFGFKDKQEYCERFFELLPEQTGPNSTEMAFDYLKVALETGYQRFEVMQQLPDGTPFPCEVTLVRIPRDNGYMICGYTRDLREQKAMLAQMREMDERAYMMLDSNPQGCQIWDENFKVIDCNSAVATMFGFKNKQEFIDRFLELLPEQEGQNSKEMVFGRLKEAFETGYKCFESVQRMLDGTPIPCEITLVRIPQEHGYVICAYTRDLREQKAMLAKIFEANEHTQVMLDATPMACALFNLKNEVIDCNLESVNMAGLNSKQEFCKRFFELSPEYQPNGQSSAEMTREKFALTVKTGYQRYEWMHQKLDGTPIPAEVTLVRVKLGDDYIIAGYSHDLRETKKYEAEQKRDQLRMNALLELAQMTQHSEQEIIDYTIRSAASLTNSTIGYVIQLDHTSANAPFRALHIDQSDFCVVPTITEVMIPHMRSTTLTESLRSKKAVIHNDLASMSWNPMFPEGHYPVNSCMNAPIMDGQTPIGIIGVGNKTELYTEMDAKHLTLFAQGLGTLLNRRKYAEYLKKAKTEAENANKAKSDFLARMSHEIRTPMNAVLGMAELALREDIPTVAYEQIATIKQSGQSLLSIINDILDFSKIESGKLEIVAADYSLASLLNDVVSIIQMRIADSPVRFVVNIDSNIPNNLIGDEVRIRQVMLNILSNAVKYTDEGSVALNITGSISDANKDVIILAVEVSDTGKGIKQENVDNLFDEFTRFDLTNNKNIEGTGLGLAIVHGLVTAMDGHIAVHSEYGAGSTFTVTLPQKIHEHDKLATVENSENLRVLVYERRRVHADSIVRTFDNLGVECALVATDSEFDEKISSGNWSFLFIASVLYKNIQERYPTLDANIKIVLVVGFGETAANHKFNILSLPAHSISVTNILNGGHGSFTRNEYMSMIRFTAPEAAILVVDDISTNLNVMEGLLMPYKTRVKLCKSGKEALEAISTEKYDVVFMDHMMPEMDGIETTTRIRALNTDDSYYAQVPIIALTANAISGIKQMFLENGFNDFLSKPIDTIKLDGLLAKWIPREKRLKFKSEDPPTLKSDSTPSTTLSLLVSFGINVKKGIALSRGNAENYKQALATFLGEGKAKVGQIKMALKTDRLPLYVTYVHGVKSAAANIGADELSELAKALETAGNQEDLPYIQAHNPPFLSALESLLHGIDAALKSESSNKPVENVDSVSLKAELVKLKTAIERVDPRAIKEAVKNIQPFMQAADVGDAVKKILQNVSIGEYDEAVSIINNGFISVSD